MTSVTYSEVQCTFCLTTGLTQIYRPSPWFGSGSHPVDRFYGTCDCKRPSPPSGKTREKWSELHYRRTVEYFPVSGKQFLRFLMGFHRVWTGRCTGLLRYPVWGPPRGTVIHNTNVVFNVFLSQLTDNCDMFYFHLPVWVWTEGPSVPGKPPLSGLFSLAGVKWGSRMGQRWRTPWSTLGTPTLTWKGHEKYPLWWSHSSNGGWSRLPWQQSVIVPTTSRKRIKFDTRKTMTTKNTYAERSLKTKFKASN